MLIRPELRALRRDDTPQCDAQNALRRATADWEAKADTAALLVDLRRFAAGSPLEQCLELSCLFTPGTGAARRLALDYTTVVGAALDLEPLGHVTQRHFTDGITSTLLIARVGNVTLSLVAIDGHRMCQRPQSTSASFGPTQTWEYILAGSAEIELVECEPAREHMASLVCRSDSIGPDSIMHRDGAREARLLRRIDGALVSLRLQRRRVNAEITSEYDLASGRLLHQAAGNPRESRVELMMALLGRMGRNEAAPLMASLALDHGSAGLRWQALRECLALDTATGFQALSQVAVAPDDSLCAPAGALRAQLIEAYPQLQEALPCPA